MENTTIIFKWKTGKIELLPERLVDYSVSAAELKKLFNIATENREEVQEQVREYLTGRIAELDPEALKREGKMLSTYGEKTRKHILSLLSAIEDRKQTKQERALSKIVKSCAKNRPDFSGVFQDAGKYCVCDGYLLIRCASPVSGLNAAKRTIDTENAIGNLADYTVALQLPTIKELKADIKIAKNGVEFGRYHIEHIGRKIFVLYDFGYGLPLVNAEYLLTMLEALPDCEAFAVPGMTSHPVYFRSGNDDGILLPVHKRREFEEAPADTAETAAQSAAEIQQTGDMEPQEESAEAAAEATEETATETAADEEYQAEEEKALARVEAVAAAVKVSEEDESFLGAVCRQYKRGYITEDEAKKMLAFPVSAVNRYALALPAPKEEPEAVAVAVVNPAVVVSAACAVCSSVTVLEACRDIDGSREAEDRGSSRTEAEAPPGNPSPDRSAACCSVSRGSGPGYISAALCAFYDRSAACCAGSICYYDTS